MKRLIRAGLIISLLCAACFGQDAGGRETLRRRPAGGDAASAQSAGDMEVRIADLTQQITREMSENQKRTVAVVEFVDLNGRVTDFGRFLAEELITRLYQTRKFKVIERQLLNKIISEQKLSLTGVVDPASAKQLGKLLGVEAIVSGTVTNLAQSVRVNARLISTETGEIFAAASTEIFKDESVTGLMAKGGAPSARDFSPPAQSASATKTLSQRAKDFVFELSSCKLHGETITCYLTVKNDLPEDRDLIIYANASSRRVVTRLYDEFGNEYNATFGSLGSKSDKYSSQSILVSQVPTKASIEFEGVSAQVSKVTLSMVIAPGNQGNMSAVRSPALTLTFRDIQVTK